MAPPSVQILTPAGANLLPPPDEAVFTTIGTVRALQGHPTPAAGRHPLSLNAAGVRGQDFQFTEGPCWSSEQGSWFFSDIPANTLFQYK